MVVYPVPSYSHAGRSRVPQILIGLRVSDATSLVIEDVRHSHLLDGMVLSLGLIVELIGKIFSVERRESTFVVAREEKIFAAEKRESTFRSIQ